MAIRQGWLNSLKHTEKKRQNQGKKYLVTGSSHKKAPVAFVNYFNMYEALGYFQLSTLKGIMTIRIGKYIFVRRIPNKIFLSLIFLVFGIIL